MQEFSKYRMITAGIILMFIFAIAAIYTNTKDAAVKKMQGKSIPEQNRVIDESGTNIDNTQDFATKNTTSVASDNNVNNQILQITERIDQLERKVFSPQNNSESVQCNVRGIINEGHVVPLSASDAINESRNNNKEVLITCVFK